MFYPASINNGILSPTVFFGADPEAFIKKNDKIVGSERVIPEAGLTTYPEGPKVIRDGVQIEFNIVPSVSQESVIGSLETAILKLREKIHQEPGFEVCFDQVVTISQEELNALSEKSRQFGCAISYNLYGLEGPSADPSTYLYRSGGGHIHFGLSKPIFDPKTGIPLVENDPSQGMVYEVDERPRLVRLLDVIVGNIGVLIDRHPLTEERRKNYGKAGEYRLPKYGLEYRTLSNFWLQSPSLFSLVLGLCRLSTGILHTTLTTERNYEEELLNEIDIDDVVESIQHNDLVLAHKTWGKVSKFIQKNVKPYEYQFGLTSDQLNKFEFFLKKIEEYGLDYWYPGNPLSNWANPRKLSWQQFLYSECDYNT